MKRVNAITHKGKRLLEVNLSGLDVSTKFELLETLKEANAQVAKNPPKSVLIITDVTGVRFDREISSAFTQYAKNNSPYIAKSAVVGVEGLQRVMLNTLKALTSREYYLAKSIEDAKEHLVQ